MYKNFKIVCNTAAGRRRYMQYLVPPVLESGVVDRYDIWVNTVDRCDIAFFEMLASKFPKINLVRQPEGRVCGNRSINAFYRDCCDEDTVYIKLDDDIVWLEPGFFAKMAAFRVEHPEYFLVSPLVINNAKGTYFLQTSGKLALREYQDADSLGDVLWRSGAFARELHEWFLTRYLEPGKHAELHLGAKPVAATRFSINCIAWFGRDMAGFGGRVPGDDEEWLSCTKPSQLGKANCYFCDAMVSHFAFFTQRETLDAAGILGRYGAFLHEEWKKDPRMSAIDGAVQECMRCVSGHEEEIARRPCPWALDGTVLPVPSRKRRIRMFLEKHAPPWISVPVLALRDFYKKDGIRAESALPWITDPGRDLP